MRVVIFGPGKIGCGYLAPLFALSGWDVVLVARSSERARRISEGGRFLVRVSRDGAPSARTSVTPVPGTTSSVERFAAMGVDGPELADAVAAADLVCTSVGVANVPALGAPLARALAARPHDRPLDVWVVENAPCAPILEREVAAAAAAGRTRLPPVGFVGAVAKVAVARGDWRTDGDPVFVGDAARELLVDETAALTGIPALPGVAGTDHYLSSLREKLYVFNTGHAISAYLGWLRGHATVAAAVADPYLRPMIAGAMLESRRALVRVHPELGTEVEACVAEAMARFADEELADPVTRVARDPIRKLGPTDRLLGPVRMIRQATQRVPVYFALAVAGALLFHAEEDREARELRALLRTRGLATVLHQVCGLEENDPFARATADRYRSFVLTDDGWMFPPAEPGGWKRVVTASESA